MIFGPDFARQLSAYFVEFAKVGKNIVALGIELVQSYISFVFKVLVRLIIVTSVVVVTLIIGNHFGWNGTVCLCILAAWLALALIVLVVVLAPAIWVWQKLQEYPSVQRTVRLILAIIFWGAFLPILCLQPSVREHPQAVISLMAIFAVLATGSAAGLLWFPARTAKVVLTVQIAGMFIMTAIAIRFPHFVKALQWRAARVDDQIANNLVGKPIETVSYDDPDQIVFVNAAGDPVLYGAKVGDIWLLAREGGHHRSGVELRPIVEPADRDAIRAWVASQRKSRLEAQRLAAAAEEAVRDANRKRDAARVEAKQLADLEELRADKQREVERVAAQQREQIERRRIEEEQYRLAHVNERALQLDPQIPSIGIMVVNSTGIIDGESNSRICEILKSRNLRASSDLLTPMTATDGSFERLVRSDAKEIDRLRLRDVTDYLLLGRSRVVSQGPSDSGVIKSTVTVDLQLLPLRGNADSLKLSLSSYGVAFKPAAAEERARMDLAEKFKEVWPDVLKAR